MSPAATRIDLLRHGRVNGGSRFLGRSDDLLSAEGWLEMQRAVAQGEWDLIVTSPRRRCSDFATALGGQRSLAVIVEPALAEMNFGEWEGKTALELMTSSPLALTRFWTDPDRYPPPGGEALAEFAWRVEDSWRQLFSAHTGQRVLVVTHGGVIRLLAALTRGLPPRRLLEFEAGYASLWQQEAVTGIYQLMPDAKVAPC